MDILAIFIFLGEDENRRYTQYIELLVKDKSIYSMHLRLSFWFHAVKNFTTAEGGAVTWRQDIGLNDEALHRQYMLLSLHGQSKDALTKSQLGSWEYDILLLGYKYNMTDILAAIGLKQLDRYGNLLKRRRELVSLYERLTNTARIESLKHASEDFLSSHHLYLVRIPEFSETERNDLILLMEKDGISCNVHYKPLPMFTAYKKLGFCIENYPNSLAQYRNEISLPLHTHLKDENVEYIAERFLYNLELTKNKQLDRNSVID